MHQGQRNIFRQAAQKRLDLSIRKNFRSLRRSSLQYEFNVFNVTNTTSLDVPQDQAQIRQNYACSDTANLVAATTTAQLRLRELRTNRHQLQSRRSAIGPGNLDQIPFTTGTGKSIQAPTTIPVNQQDANGVVRCVAYNAISNTQGCPNNAANFGSVTGTIGGARAFTMGSTSRSKTRLPVEIRPSIKTEMLKGAPSWSSLLFLCAFRPGETAKGRSRTDS